MFRTALSTIAFFGITLLLSFLFAPPVHAQDGIVWGVRGEVGVSSFGGDTDALVTAYGDLLSTSDAEIALMPKYSIGGVLFVPLTSWLRIEPMASVEETGVALQATRSTFGFFETEETIRAEISSYYMRLTLPLAFHTDISSNWTLRASAGPIVRGRMGGDDDIVLRDPGSSTRVLLLETAAWDTGMTVGAGIETPFAGGTLLLDLGVDLGITDIASLQSPGTIAPRHRALHFGFGYRFGE